MARRKHEGHFVVEVFGYDINGFSRVEQAEQERLKACADRALDEAKRSVGLASSACFYQDAGDGAYVMLLGCAGTALALLESFAAHIAKENSTTRRQHRLKFRCALHHGSILAGYKDGQLRCVGDGINDCARLLSGMPRDFHDQVVCSGAYRSHVLTFESVDEAVFTRLHDIVDKHGKRHEVWNLCKMPGYGIPVAGANQCCPLGRPVSDLR